MCLIKNLHSIVLLLLNLSCHHGKTLPICLSFLPVACRIYKALLTTASIYVRSTGCLHKVVLLAIIGTLLCTRVYTHKNYFPLIVPRSGDPPFRADPRPGMNIHEPEKYKIEKKEKGHFYITYLTLIKRLYITRNIILYIMCYDNLKSVIPLISSFFAHLHHVFMCYSYCCICSCCSW